MPNHRFHHLHHAAVGHGRHGEWLVRVLHWFNWFARPHVPNVAGLAHLGEELVGLVAVVGVIVAAVLFGRRWLPGAVDRGQRLYALRLPREVDRGRLAQVLAGVAAGLRGGIPRSRLGLELRADEGRIRVQLVTVGVPEGRLRRLVGEALPGARLDLLDEQATARGRAGERLHVVSLAARRRDHAPLETDFAADPAGLILRALGDTGPNEIVVVQLLFGAAASRARSRLLADATRLRMGRPRRSWLELVLLSPLLFVRGLWNFFDSPPRSHTRSHQASAQAAWVDRPRVQALYEKAREPLFACSLRLAAAASSRLRTRGLLRELRDGYAPFEGFNGLRRMFEPFASRRFARRLLPLRQPLLLSASELAALLPLPANVGEAPVPLDRAPARELAPASAAPRKGIRLGVSAARGRIEPVYVSPRALLQHLHLLGATGAGKTTTLLSIALQAIELNLGCLVAEPKGDLIGALLERLPVERVDDVALLDFGDPGFPPAFNLLTGGRGQGEAVAGIFSRLYGGNWGPRSDDLLRAALLTLEGGVASGEVPTLADVLPLLTDPRRRRRYRITDPVVLPGFWQGWERFSEGQRQQALAPLANKLRALLLRPAVRDALVQPEAPDLAAAIRERKIVLCSLPSATHLLGEDGASLFGSVLLHRLWQAALSLGPSASRSPFLCLVDEAHRFTALPGGIGELLAQARGYGLGLVLAHQQLAQLSPELRETVAINCRSKLCFQLDPPDNERMARHFEPQLDATDLLMLDRYQLACRLVEDGLVLPAVTATAAAAPEPEDAAVADLVRSQKRLQTRSKHEVEALIGERFPELERPPRGEVRLESDGPADGLFGGTSDVPPNVPPSPHGDANRGDSENSDSSPEDDEDRPWAA